MPRILPETLGRGILYGDKRPWSGVILRCASCAFPEPFDHPDFIFEPKTAPWSTDEGRLCRLCSLNQIPLIRRMNPEHKDSRPRHGNTARLRRFGILHLSMVIYALLLEIRVLFLHSLGKWRARRYRNQQLLRLHFGCGDNIRQGWVNIDLSPSADLQLDLRKRLPFADGSCECTYSEHFFEHLDFPDDAILFLRENLRVLASGGILTFGVPDAGAALESYVCDRAQRAPMTPFPAHPSWVRTGMDQINFLFRQNYIYLIHQHRYAYDLETLQVVLTEVGFSDIRQRGFDPLLDSESRRNGTLYVSARKA